MMNKKDTISTYPDLPLPNDNVQNKNKTQFPSDNIPLTCHGKIRLAWPNSNTGESAAVAATAI